MLPEIHTILYATDLGQQMRPAFRLALSIAERYDAKVIMLHALEPLGSFGKVLLDTYLPPEAAEKMREEGFAKVRAKMRKRLERFCVEELGSKPQECHLVADVVVVDGPVPVAISEQAEARKADLIVVGTHGHSAVGNFLLGSTARRLTQISPIPVLVVPTGPARL